MNKQNFIQGHLETLLNDKEIKPFLDMAQSEREREMLTQNLKLSLGRSYDTYAKEYFDTKGVGSYLSTLLRLGGGVADAVGTYMFWTLGGAGFGIKGVGILEKTAAEAIDAGHYAKFAETDTLTEKVADEVKGVGEGVVERALAYLPFGVGELTDFIRGGGIDFLSRDGNWKMNKFDRKVINRAVDYAKNDFLDYVRKVDEKVPYTIPLEKFKDTRYAASESTALAA